MDELSERVRRAIKPSPMCRDCADFDGRCPRDDELCDPNDKADDIANSVARALRELQSLREESEKVREALIMMVSEYCVFASGHDDGSRCSIARKALADPDLLRQEEI